MQNIYGISLPYNTIKFNNRCSTDQSRPEGGGVGGGVKWGPKQG